MLKQFKSRFLGITVVLLTLLVTACLCSVYFLMQRSEEKEALTILYQEMQEFSGIATPIHVNLSEHYSLESRNLAYLKCQKDKKIVSCTYNYGDLDLEESADNIVSDLINKSETMGTLEIKGDYYRYLKQDNAEFLYIVLLNQSSELQTMSRLKQNLVIMEFGAILMILLIGVLLTKWASKPVADAWNRQQGFVEDASHEMKTPLSVIATNTDLVLSNPESLIQSQDKWLKYIDDETGKMTDLVYNLLYLAKMDANEIKCNKQILDFTEIVEAYCMEQEIDFFEHSHELVYEIEKNLNIYADQEQISKMLFQLFSNAKKYALPDTKVYVDLKENHGDVVLKITNQSEKITAEQLRRIFDRFYRIDHARNRSIGSYGLGLSIVKAIVEMNEGEIKASSENGITVFSVSLPMSKK